ncbi:MAG: hypothetical protein ACOYLB_17415 [Phototrophicaceae bacterium]
MNDILLAVVSLINQILTAAIVIVSFSFLLYNLTHGQNNRITRTSSIVLACVTLAYLADVLISLEPDLRVYESALRFQWLGIAILPAALMHLADALLDTTGLPSRGRRRSGIYFLYGVGLVFVGLATFTNTLVHFVRNLNTVSMLASSAFGIYIVYSLSTTSLAYFTVQRAKRRCLTRDTRRRMAYLQYAMLTPMLSVFPFSILINMWAPGTEQTLPTILLVNLTNIVVIMMLVFLSFPLSFFGSDTSEKVIKANLLEFFLHGPGTGSVALATILIFNPAVRVLGLRGNEFMPFAVVGMILMWEWGISIILPYLNRWLVYGRKQDEAHHQLYSLSNRLLPRQELLNQLTILLQSTCDYTRVNTAFIAQYTHQPQLIGTVGTSKPKTESLSEAFELLQHDNGENAVVRWQSFWILPLYSQHNGHSMGEVMGIMGIQARAQTVDLTLDEQSVLSRLKKRAEHTLDDLNLQSQLLTALEDILPQMGTRARRPTETEFLPTRPTPSSTPPDTPNEEFIEAVRAALKHYWGGHGLTKSLLLDLKIVQKQLEIEPNTATALRSILLEAIEQQKPEGEPKSTDPEWVIYNILSLRYIQGLKVKDVAYRLAMSQADLYRKQRVAIESVARVLLQRERLLTVE